jgi:hypothetical protein
MKQFTAAVLISLVPALALAQEGPGVQYRPYTFVAPGAVSTELATLHLGGGFDVVARNGLGASVEGGYLTPILEGFHYGVGAISTNAVFHAGRPRRHRVTPFVTGGYTLWFRGDTASAVNVGGGVHYWVRDGVGLRAEFRDHIPLGDYRPRPHIWGARVGFAWVR